MKKIKTLYIGASPSWVDISIYDEVRDISSEYHDYVFPMIHCIKDGRVVRFIAGIPFDASYEDEVRP